MAEKKEDKLTKNKKGKVILVNTIASSNLSASCLNPGAIIDTKNGIKISIISTIIKRKISKILNTFFAKIFALFFPLFYSVE